MTFEFDKQIFLLNLIFFPTQRNWVENAIYHKQIFTEWKVKFFRLEMEKWRNRWEKGKEQEEKRTKGWKLTNFKINSFKIFTQRK